MIDKIAVYGTLKMGFGNHRLIQNCRYLGEDTLKNFDMYSLGGFPGVIHGKGEIKVEVYELNRLETLETVSYTHLTLPTIYSV